MSTAFFWRQQPSYFGGKDLVASRHSRNPYICFLIILLSIRQTYNHSNMYTLSSTDSLFCCITTFKWGKTGEILQAEIETRVTLRLLDILPQSRRHSQRKWRNFTYIFLHICYRLPECISHCTNTLGKGMNPIILPPAMGK